MSAEATGPLRGVRVLEVAGLGAAPFGAMLLADMGAEVIRIDRLGTPDLMGWSEPRFDVMGRGRRSVALDLKREGAVETLLTLVESSDVLIEAFRPGVMERLGLGPEVCLARNPKLVYGRVTGWGQSGPLAKAAGHDLNYIALTGVLNAIGERDRAPTPPINLLGDFGGGGMLLAFGVVCALLEAKASGRGQVVDAAMLDGASLMAAMIWGMRAEGRWRSERGSNVNDGGSHYYSVYECADKKFVSIASAEPQFYALLRAKAGLTDAAFDAQNDPDHWVELKKKLAAIMRTRTRAQWCALMEGSDVCFAPVLDWDEAPDHPHNIARGAFVRVADVLQPAPAPRFSRTPAALPQPPVAAGRDTLTVLREAGLSLAQIDKLRRTGAIGQA